MQFAERAAGLVYELGAIGAPECHAATLLPLGGGDLVCAFFAGTREGHPDVTIWWSERHGGTWSTPDPLPQVEPEAHWNPVLFAQRTVAHLCFKVGPSPRNWRTWRRTRPLDRGTWGEACELVPGDVGGRGPVKNKPIQLANGALLGGASIETEHSWDCFVDRSEDGGRTWRRSALVPLDHAACPGPGIIQPTLWQSAPGRLHMLTRSSGGRIYRADSDDGGETWNEAGRTALPNNNSGIDLVRLDGGALVLAYNPVEEQSVRTPICLAVSEDNGQRWTDVAVLEDTPGEWSYPAVVETAEGIAVAYTWDRRSIMVREFSVTV